MVGNAAKSNGLVVYKHATKTIKLMAMLKVNSKSSKNGGNGSIIMTRIMMMKMGAPKVLALSPDNPCLKKSSESAELATVPLIEWITAPL